MHLDASKGRQDASFVNDKGGSVHGHEYLHDKEELKQSTQTVDEERRAFLTAGLVGGAIAAGTLAAGAAHAQQTAAAPAPALSDKPWWPHPKWGKDDQAGASNWITPAKVLDTIKIIKDGKIYRVGRVYEVGDAQVRRAHLQCAFRITPVGAAVGTNRLVGHDEFLAAEIGQTGTQFDGLGHIGIQMGKPGDLAETRFYNGVTELEMIDANGLKKLGIENCKPIFTRGHLFDVEAVKGSADGCRPGDHRRRPARRHAEAEHEGGRHQGRRCAVLQHRLGQALDEEQRQVQQRRARHRAGSRQVGASTRAPA